MIRNVLNRYFTQSTKDFKKIYKLGEGANSKVYKVHSLENNKFYTCKEYRKNNTDKINKEIEIIKSIQTKNNILPKYYAMRIEDDKIWLLTDFIEGKELFEKKYSKNVPLLPEHDVKNIIMKMIDCIEKCNKNNIIHLDIKPENYIYSYNDNISLIDFGCAQYFDNKKEIKHLNSNRIGTLLYCSPEVIYRNMYHINSDVWSLGICIYGLLTKQKLFNEHEINNPEKKYKRFNKFSPELQDLLQKIFVVNPKKRIYLEDIKKHPFIKNK